MTNTWLKIREGDKLVYDQGPKVGKPAATKGARKPRSMSLRSHNKRAEILSVARDQFLKHGFDGASIDSIVELVGGSKSTIYSHFGNKESLFAAVVREAGHAPETADFPISNGNVRDELLAFAEDRMMRVLSPLNIGIMRIVIAEASRFPKIAELFYCNAPEPTYAALRSFLQHYTKVGDLKIEDIDEATDNFLGGLLQRHLLEKLFGMQTSSSAEDIKLKSRNMVDRFIKRYGVRSESGAKS